MEDHECPECKKPLDECWLLFEKKHFWQIECPSCGEDLLTIEGDLKTLLAR